MLPKQTLGNMVNDYKSTRRWIKNHRFVSQAHSTSRVTFHPQRHHNETIGGGPTIVFFQEDSRAMILGPP